MKNRNVAFITILLALGYLVLLQRAQGVVPAPDGCYPGFTTAEGCNALNFLTNGAGNTGVGWYSLFLNSAGNYNTGVGAGTLALNNADSNTAVGTAAMLLNTSGTANVAVGTDTLLYNDSGSFNTATGDNALFSNTIGAENTANGYSAMSANTEGSFNTAIGVGALNTNTIGAGNTAIGDGAGLNITGDGNVCIGHLVIGAAGLNDTTWIRNINTTGQGFVAGTNNYVTVRMTDGRLGYSAIVSSRRYKEDIKPMDKASEALLALKPVTFRLRGELDPSHRPQWGLIAEEVEKVNPDLVDRNNKGEVESVRYDMVNAMLLNEFLKEHATVQELKREIAGLNASLKKQAAQIQKLTAKVDIAQPASQVIATRQ